MSTSLKDVKIPSKRFSDMTPEELFMFEVDHNIEYLQKALDQWKVKFTEDPMYALEWSDDVFRDSAKLYLWKLLHLTVSKIGIVEGKAEFLKRCQEEALRAAKWPSRSTSPQTNISKQALGSAWAYMFEDLAKMKTGEES